MGGCISSPRDINGPASDSTDGTVTIGKNQPLKHEKPKWRSDVPLTEGQLRSKRDEFWDTAPAFEGRKEIWDALKAAAYALETNDHALAQAIIDGASISLPNGTLMDCYDELGNRYQLPVYVLSAPANLIQESSDTDTATDSESGPPTGTEIPIKFRLSTTSNDIKLVVRSTDTVMKIKRRLHAEFNIDPRFQRWFFSGRLLSNKMTIDECKIPKGFVVQVIIFDPSSVNNS
ncbi:ubiquitin domain-containing protein 2-like [Tubulanus polymorphus]|uniref:ubiquitin domain-containing protein 2-like n=1 Tax=Tubulanus polymorphus TaxID=672921 RepID=UPI003DA6A7AA